MLDATDKFMEEVGAVESPMQYRLSMGDFNARSPREWNPSGSLPNKEFLPRNSLLTDLLEINHFRTVYHMFIVISVLLFLYTVITYNILDPGIGNLDFRIIRGAFGNFRVALVIWVGMFICSFAIVYLAFYTWSHQRSCLANNPLRLRMWDGSWLVIYIAYISLAIYVPTRQIMVSNLYPASSAFVLLEQIRLIMKTHAFVRSNIPRALTCQKNLKKEMVCVTERGPGLPFPEPSKYLYFLFAPTLVYRDTYPRTLEIRWSWVGWHFAQVLAVIFYSYIIVVRYNTPIFRQLGSTHEPFTAKSIVLRIFDCILPGTMMFVCGFFGFLHAWLNAFAEMLRFADRMFYRDWWNATSYAYYYRAWNTVVRDWLYTYIYKDFYELCGRTNRVLPMLAVFLVSSVFHEYIVTFMSRNFYPVLLILFNVVGTNLVIFKLIMERMGRFSNIFLWFSLFMGNGVLVGLYSMEYYARINCPLTLDPWLDFFVPRSWTCQTVAVST